MLHLCSTPLSLGMGALPMTQGQQNQLRLSCTCLATGILTLYWYEKLWTWNIKLFPFIFGWCRQTQEPDVPRGTSDSTSWPSQLSKSPIKILIKSYLSPVKSSKLHISTYACDYFYSFPSPYTDKDFQNVKAWCWCSPFYLWKGHFLAEN